MVKMRLKTAEVAHRGAHLAEAPVAGPFKLKVGSELLLNRQSVGANADRWQFDLSNFYFTFTACEPFNSPALLTKHYNLEIVMEMSRISWLPPPHIFLQFLMCIFSYSFKALVTHCMHN